MKPNLIKIPPLRKKGRKLADLDPNSLAAALHHRELAEGTKDQADPATEDRPGGESPASKPPQEQSS
jgi:hypothetical protein